MMDAPSRAGARSTTLPHLSSHQLASTEAATRNKQAPYEALYHETWAQWTEDAAPDAKQRRGDAVVRMRQCLAQRADTLNLGGLELECLPPLLPPDLTTLLLPFNRFTALPSELPAGLAKLNLCDNHIGALDGPLPSTLEWLDVSHNALHELPADLPAGVTTLLARHNQISTLQPQLPPGLRRLDLAHNALTQLTALPPALQELNVCGNGLRTLPMLPNGLGCLHASNNALHRLPAQLPPRLAELNLRHNLFNHIPEAIFRLPRWAVVRLEGNMQLHIAPMPRDRQHPHIYTTVHSFGPEAPRPLAETVAPWLGGTPPQAWTDMDRESHAAVFSGFLERLAGTRSAQDSAGFRQQVRHWLQMLARTPALRAQCFTLAANATASCADSIALQYNQMQQAWLAHQVHAGELDGDLPAVVALGRQLFRLECLEQAARQRLLAIPTTDAIELFLAYQVKLRQVLALEHGVDAMHFFGLTNLDRGDLADTAVEVKHAENREFRAWLLDWPAWQGVLQRLAPALAHEAASALAEALTGERFRGTLDARLAAAQLQDVPDAEVQLGKLLMTELQRESNEALAISVLGAAQCDALLAPYWPPS